jgi:hypothetical protein
VILTLTRHERPIFFFGLASAVLAFVSGVLAFPVFTEYVDSGRVPRLPTLFVASFLLVIACLCLAVGLVLDGMRKSRHEVSRLSYMRHPAVRDAYIRDPAPGQFVFPSPREHEVSFGLRSSSQTG